MNGDYYLIYAVKSDSNKWEYGIYMKDAECPQYFLSSEEAHKAAINLRNFMNKAKHPCIVKVVQQITQFDSQH
jgi:hypothetical protein